MHCIDPGAAQAAPGTPAPARGSARGAAALRGEATGLVALMLILASFALGGCQTTPPSGPATAVPHSPPPPSASTTPAAPIPPIRRAPPPRPERPTSMDHLRILAARRLVAMNPSITYAGQPPEVLLAIPVLEVELNADGSVRRIEVLRHPRQAQDTTQIAIDAVRRAAPFGDVSHLPRPWKFTETFLFDDSRRFKPRTLDG